MFEEDSNNHCNDLQIKLFFRFGWMCFAKKTRPTSPQLLGFLWWWSQWLWSWWLWNSLFEVKRRLQEVVLQRKHLVFICCLTICLITLRFFQPWSEETITKSDSVDNVDNDDIDNGSEVDLIITNSRFYESQLIFFQPWSEETVARSDPSEEKEGSRLVHGKPSSIKKSKQPKKHINKLTHKTNDMKEPHPWETPKIKPTNK